jgi:hypothetical protein
MATRKSGKKKAKKKPRKVLKKRPKKHPKKKPKKILKRKPRRPRKPPVAPPVVKKPKSFIITLTSDDQGVDIQPTLSRGGKDLVQWKNESSVERRLTFKFNRWPFEDFPCEIVVPKDGTTGWYRTEKRDNEHGKVNYEYTSDPPFSPGGAPGDPIIDSDG